MAHVDCFVFLSLDYTTCRDGLDEIKHYENGN